MTVEGHRADDGSEGLAMLSRVPLVGAHAETLPISDPPRRVLVADVECSGGPVTVVCGHTVAVPEEVRREQVRALLARAARRSSSAPTSTTRRTRSRRCSRDAGLHDALDGDQVVTWPMNELTFGEAWRSVIGHAPQFSLEPRRLDYLLSRGLDVVEAGVDELQPDGGPHASDHALVWARYTVG